jgi:hypothetical protein
MDFHETSHLALSTYPLQNDLSSDPPKIKGTLLGDESWLPLGGLS